MGMKKSQIESLVSKLVAEDADLSGKEKELIRVIQKMYKLDETVKIDANFKDSLKKNLLREFSNVGERKGKGIFNFMSMQKFQLAFVMVVLVVVSVFGSGVYFNSKNQELLSLEAFSSNVDFKPRGSNAFGNLVSNNMGGKAELQSVAAPALGSSDMTMSARPQSGGGGSAASSKIAIAPYRPYVFKYKGETLSLTESSGDVFRRVKNVGDGGIASVLKRVSFGLIDLGKFSDLRVSAFTLIQDKENGYVINVNTDEGTIFINENWQKWYRPMNDCTNQECFDRYKLKPSDVPVDSELISLSDKFLNDYGVDKSVYGEPKVLKYWDNPVSISARADVYIPEVVSVV
jgi:hypothetical protein